MKKTYMTPSSEVVKITASSILCGSLDPLGGKGSVTEEKVSSGTEGESRLFDFDYEDGEY